MKEERFLVLNNTEYLIVDEVVKEGKKYYYLNSMTDENEIAIVEEYIENNETLIKSVDDVTFNQIMSEITKKLLNEK